MRSIVAAAILLALFVFSTNSCYGPAYHEPLAHGYALFAMDNGTDVSFVEDGRAAVMCVVDPRVFAVGWDNAFFIVKQHPDPAYGPKSAPALNRAQPSLEETRFYIVRVRDKRLFGPFTESEFGTQRTALGLSPTLSFTKILTDLQ